MTVPPCSRWQVDGVSFARLGSLLQRGGSTHSLLFSRKRPRKRKRRRGAAGGGEDDRSTRDTVIKILSALEDEMPFSSKDPNEGTALLKIRYFISLFLM